MKLYILKSLVAVLIIATVSCSSKEEKQKKALVEQAKTDSLKLIYHPSEADPKVEAFMQNLHKRSGFNGNVLIAKNGKILYQNSFGWANYLLKDSLKIDSKFELASVSKPLTGIGILKLVEEGKLKLDQTINDFYPNFPYPDITIKQLLSHRSGLPNYVYFSEEHWKEKKKGMTNQDVMNMLIEFKPNRYGKPDGKFFYNNSNFMVLGAIIEKVTNQSYAEWMKENVFNLAGMTNTAALSKAIYEKIPTDVIGHDKVWRRSVVQNFQDGPLGDKGIYSTVRDLYKLDLALNEGRLLKKETLDSAYVDRAKSKNGIFGYGLGWRTFHRNNDIIIYHTGWWHGFRNLYVRDLKNNVTIVLLSNMTNGSLVKLDELYKILGMPILRKGVYNDAGNVADDV